MGLEIQENLGTTGYALVLEYIKKPLATSLGGTALKKATQHLGQPIARISLIRAIRVIRWLEAMN